MALQLYKIATVEVGSAGSGTIAFSSIPQGYTDLKLVVSARTDRASVVDDLAISFNGSTSSFSGRELYGTGATATSITTARAAGTAAGATSTANAFGNTEIYIPNYTVTSVFKSFTVDGVQETNATTAYTALYASLWSNTAAISSISFTPLVGSLFTEYSTATLYGIL